MSRSTFIGSLVLSLLLVSRSAAQVRYVDGSAPPGGDGTSWARAMNDLELALIGAAPPAVTQVWVRAATYKPLNASNSFVLPAGVAVYGGFAGTETSLDQRDPALNVTVLDGDIDGDDLPGFVNYLDNADHVVSATGASAHLDGFTVRGGRIGPGGGLSLFAGQVTLTRLIVKENQGIGGTNAGGGAWVEAATVSVTDCAFADNRATGGAGLVLSDPTDATVSRCSFDRHDATGGGGISIRGVDTGSVSIVDCAFRDNTATGGGGLDLSVERFQALSVDGCTFDGQSATSGAGLSVHYEVPGFVSVTDSSFRDNTATAGGGIAITSGGVEVADVVISGCLFEGNDACAGGGLYVNGGDVEVVACEFRENHSTLLCGTGAGGGAIRLETGRDAADVSQSLFLNSNLGLLWGERGADFTATLCTFVNEDNGSAAIHLKRGRTSLQLDSCIVWGTAALQLETDDLAMFSAVYSDVRMAGAGLPGPGNLDVDPRFVNAAAGDLRLGALSPCIDAGNPVFAFAGADLDRDSRLLDGDLDGSVVADMGADEFGPIHLEITGTPAPGNTLTFDTTGAPGLAAFMWIDRPGLRFFPQAGTLFLALVSPLRSPWPATPSSVQVTVPAGVSGLWHVQEIALGGGAIVLSNHVPVQF